MPPVAINEQTWKFWGIEAAREGKMMTVLIDEYKDSLMELPLTDRKTAGDALVAGWIEGAEESLAPAQAKLEARWGALGLEIGKQDALNANATSLEALTPHEPTNDLATDLGAMSPLNRVTAVEALLTGIVRGYAANVRARLQTSGGGL